MLIPVALQNKFDGTSSETGKQDLTLPRPVTENKLFHPESPCGHEMLELTVDNISVITVKTLKISGDKIVDECKKRQIPRFRYELSINTTKPQNKVTY